jgi:predicted esterase
MAERGNSPSARLCAVLLLCLGCSALAQTSLTAVQRVTLTELFPADETAALAKTLPADRQVNFRVRVPTDAAPTGVLVFVSANDSGELPAAWAPVLDSRHLLWISADGFGNSQLAAQRVLVGLMAARLAQRFLAPGSQRIYISGFSGGGRVASMCITRFPRYFHGALFIAGADFAMPDDTSAASRVAARRLVFLTGNRDFNQREMKSVYRRYREAGVSATLLMDERGFGHELASAGQLDTAIEFLDSR